jgi:hypothetical protein
MRNHIHFTLLVLGTMAFLYVMRMYTAPLILGEHDYAKETQYGTVMNGVILDLNANSLHTTFIIKECFKAVAIYLAFVVIVFSHRSFYAANRPGPTGVHAP